MDATEEKATSTVVATRENLISQLNRLFGSFKAEWLDQRVFQFFNEPSYYTELSGRRPSVLIGGRGTGKTTVLKGLSYEGQFAMRDSDIKSFKSLESVGIYYKVDTTRVSALAGPEIANWSRVLGTISIS